MNLIFRMIRVMLAARRRPRVGGWDAYMMSAAERIDWSPEQIRRQVASLGEWFHNLNLNGGLWHEVTVSG